MQNLRLLALWVALATTFVSINTADAARRKWNKKRNFSTCPWKGPPTIEKMGGGVLIIANTKFRLGKPKHLYAFQSLLNLCNAGHVVPSFTQWRQAQSIVTAKAAAASAYAVSAGVRAALTDSDAERRAIAREAAVKAAEFAAEMVPLTADAKAKKLLFQAEFMGTSAP